MSVDADGSRPAKVIGEVACHDEGGVFCSCCMIAVDVFVFWHPVFNWQGCTWHVF